MTLSIMLPDSLKAFVEEQTTLGGYQTPSDYICYVLSEAQDRKDRGELAAKLETALASEPSEMERGDWEQMRVGVRRAGVPEISRSSSGG